MPQSIEIAVTNLTSVPVLVFILGFLAARTIADVSIPDAIYQFLSIYLLFGIGLKGGHALKHVSLTEVLRPSLMTLALGVLIPFIAFYLLELIKNLQDVDRGSIAAHYGSTSLVTFSAALLILESNKIAVEGFAPTLLTIMEIPGLVVGIFLATRSSIKTGAKSDVHWRETFQEIILGKTVLLLVGGLIIGAITSDAGYEKVSPFFVNLLNGFLSIFLLQIGFMAGKNFHQIRSVGFGMIAYALLFPVLAGFLGAVGGNIVGLSIGGTTALAVLCASASYIAAPAAVAIALPQAKNSLAITCAIGLTFPFNLIIGIPLYENFARLLS